MPEPVQKAETPEEKERFLQEYVDRVYEESGIKMKKSDISESPNPGMGIFNTKIT